MNCSTNSFGRNGPADSGELKAIMFALLSCFLFITFLTVVHRRATRNDRHVTRVRSEPVMPVAAPDIAEPPPSPPDMYSRFREVPPNFRGINFVTRSYGNYQLSDGTNRDLLLVNGRLRFQGDSQHWFDLHDVLYTDLTGDDSPEAIVMINHLECGPACDGGKNLIYVYSSNYGVRHQVLRSNGVVDEILKYETGSGLNGCSLKTLEVKNRRLTLDLFGRCPQPVKPSGEFTTNATYDLTRLEFSFDGKQLVEKSKTFLKVLNRGEVNYGADVRITDNRSRGL